MKQKLLNSYYAKSMWHVDAIPMADVCMQWTCQQPLWLRAPGSGLIVPASNRTWVRQVRWPLLHAATAVVPVWDPSWVCGRGAARELGGDPKGCGPVAEWQGCRGCADHSRDWCSAYFRPVCNRAWRRFEVNSCSVLLHAMQPCCCSALPTGSQMMPQPGSVITWCFLAFRSLQGSFFPEGTRTSDGLFQYCCCCSVGKFF